MAAGDQSQLLKSSFCQRMRKAGADYVAAFALCLVILFITLKLWRADFHVPFSYQGDSLFALLWIKGIVENGWYLHQDRVGFPGGSDMHDYPMADSFHFGVLKLLSYFSTDPAVIFNWFYLLSFPLVLMSSLTVLRQFGLAGARATIPALLYTFLPFHFLRGLGGHLFLMSYFMIPPAVLVAVWICMSPRSSQGFEEQTGDSRFGKSHRLIALLICGGLSSTGIYYAFFGCFLFGVAGLICLGQKDVRGSLASLVLIGIVVLGVLANLLPHLLYRQGHGTNPGAVVRTMAAPEVFGMKITQLVLPMSMHRLGWLAREKMAYNAALPVGCSDFGYLGVFGVLGFVGLLCRFLFKKTKPSSPCLLDILQTLNLCTLLVATVGGFGMVGTLFLGPWIRCFERMSIIIAFLSLLAVGLLATRSIDWLPWFRRSRLILPGVLGCVLVGGIWEETSPYFAPKYATLSKEYAQDAFFTNQIETNVPDGAAVFQLPYVPFPENGLLNRMSDYDHLRAYLHSRTLRWSYGAMKGREGDAWQRSIAKLPTQDMVRALQTAGFEGIYLDRYGYEDNGARIEKSLTRLLGRPLLVSANGRWSFFKLWSYESPIDSTIALRNP